MASNTTYKVKILDKLFTLVNFDETIDNYNRLDIVEVQIPYSELAKAGYSSLINFINDLGNNIDVTIYKYGSTSPEINFINYNLQEVGRRINQEDGELIVKISFTGKF